MITGKTLIDWGYKPGAWFKDAITKANEMVAAGNSEQAIRAHMSVRAPSQPQTIPLRATPLPYSVFLEPENDAERENLAAVTQKMDELLRVPTAVSGVVLPDACPTGDMPVGTVIATKDAIHPGFHSADVCCSMAITVFKRQDDLKKILDAAQAITHFGPGGRKNGFKLPPALRMNMDGNRFLSDRVVKGVDIAESNLGTQGDGNHFLFVGTLASTGQPAIVTHHGSRGVGAMLYKRGMAVAKKHTAIHSPRTPDKSAWIDATSDDGRAYWDALQLVRQWTKWNHFLLHDAIQRSIGNQVVDRFWNEHNFVFYRNGLYYHAKGATPSFSGFSPDDNDGRTLIPMNMAEPILIMTHRDNPAALGFSPHGAGRNMSRTQHIRNLATDWGIEDDPRGLSPRHKEAIFRDETRHLDIRSYLGRPDLSELPSAYKSAEQVRSQISKHDLAKFADQVIPYGSIMAGEITWNKHKKGK